MIITTDKAFNQDLKKDAEVELTTLKSNSYNEEEMSQHLNNIEGGSIHLNEPINDNFPEGLDSGFATTNDNSKSPYYSLGDGGD